MADNKYFDYGKLDAISPYQAGKTKPTAFTKDTRNDKANENATQRKTDLTQVRDSNIQTNLVSGIKRSINQSAAQILTSGAGNMDSTLSSMVNSDIQKSGKGLVTGGNLDSVLSNLGSKISKKA
jgi:hypothetical protein